MSIIHHQLDEMKKIWNTYYIHYTIIILNIHSQSYDFLLRMMVL